MNNITYLCTMNELNIEFHKPMSGFVTISKGSKKLILPMKEWDKLPTKVNKRNKQLEDMLYRNE